MAAASAVAPGPSQPVPGPTALTSFDAAEIERTTTHRRVSMVDDPDRAA
jgi:hypothetical protein